MAEINELKKMASQVRRDILRMIHGVQSGHTGGSLGCADLLVALYFEVMKHDAENFSMDGENQDLFFLSNGHISPLFYSVLARSGYFPIQELGTFRKLNSRLQGHPAVAEHLPGIRIASGSLGQGLSVAIGAALAKKLNNDPQLVYCLMGDGELEEGQVWEAVMFGAGKKVDNVIAFVDFNGQQIDGPVEKVMPQGDLKAKWSAFGWEVLTMNGNDLEDIVNTLKTAKTLTGREKPVVVIMKTEMGCGVDFMMGTHKWHGIAPNNEQLENALGQLQETLGDF